jgi:hypothetical protein
LTAEAVVQHARNPDRMAPAAAPAPEVELPDAAGRWPPGLRVVFMIGAALLCWAVILLLAWWLIG